MEVMIMTNTWIQYTKVMVKKACTWTTHQRFRWMICSSLCSSTLLNVHILFHAFTVLIVPLASHSEWDTQVLQVWRSFVKSFFTFSLCPCFHELMNTGQRKACQHLVFVTFNDFQTCILLLKWTCLLALIANSQPALLYKSTGGVWSFHSGLITTKS